MTKDARRSRRSSVPNSRGCHDGLGAPSIPTGAALALVAALVVAGGAIAQAGEVPRNVKTRPSTELVPVANAPRQRPAPLDLAAVAKGASPPTGWVRTRFLRKIRPKIADAGDEGDVTGSVDARTNGSRSAKGAAKAAAKPPAPETDPALFCSNVADAASDARLAWQMRELEKAESLLRERIAELEKKRADYEKWLKLRDDFLRNAEENVVTIYSRMRPESAALQLASMDDQVAAALLAKINVRNASRILDEMEPARAAHLTNVLAGMRRVEDGSSDK